MKSKIGISVLFLFIIVVITFVISHYNITNTMKNNDELSDWFLSLRFKKFDIIKYDEDNSIFKNTFFLYEYGILSIITQDQLSSGIKIPLMIIDSTKLKCNNSVLSQKSILNYDYCITDIRIDQPNTYVTYKVSNSLLESNQKLYQIELKLFDHLSEKTLSTIIFNIPLKSGEFKIIESGEIPLMDWF